MLTEHRASVEALRDALLEREELIGDEILAVLRADGGRPGPAIAATTPNPNA